MKSTDYVILYASSGSGHKSAAMALESHIMKKSLGTVASLDVFDIIKSDYVHSLFKTDSKNPISGPTYEMIWGSKSSALIVDQFLGLTNNLLFITDAITEYHPKVIINTHWLTAQLTTKTLTDITDKQYGVVTDFRANPSWANKKLTATFVPSLVAKTDLMGCGIKPERIVVGEIPLRESFYKDYESDLETNKVLFIAGGLETEPYKKIEKKVIPIASLFEETKFKLEIICGKNEKLKTMIEDWVKDNHIKNVSITGFVEDMASKMASSMAIITKPGGLISAEALHMNLPIIYLVKNTYAQERHNLNYFINKGMAVSVDSVKSLTVLLELLSKDPSTLQYLKRNMQKEKKYNMPDLIFDRIVRDLST